MSENFNAVGAEAPEAPSESFVLGSICLDEARMSLRTRLGFPPAPPYLLAGCRLAGGSLRLRPLVFPFLPLPLTLASIGLENTYPTSSERLRLRRSLRPKSQKSDAAAPLLTPTTNDGCAPGTKSSRTETTLGGDEARQLGMHPTNGDIDLTPTIVDNARVLTGRVVVQTNGNA